MRGAGVLVIVIAGAACGRHAGDAPAIDAPDIDAPAIDAPGATDATGFDAPAGAPDAPGPDALVADCEVRHGTGMTGVKIATSTDLPVLVTSPPGQLRRFVVERGGAIRILETDHLQDPPFLDLRPASGGPVALGSSELGLLGLAFHPRYADNGKLYVFYTAPAGTKYTDDLVEYTVAAGDPDHADPTSARVLLSLPDFADNHNAGMLEFGADGYLYVATGDGGSGGDPAQNGQNKHALLAKILRLDVDHPASGKPYGIPADNPFADGVAGAPEVYVYGLRNPWRWSFDRATGDLYIGDVGQDFVEEIDVLSPAQARGANLGWGMYEGSDCFLAPCDPAGKVMPVLERTHLTPANGGPGYCAIIGGQVYRGSCYPDEVGRYFYSDYCAGLANHPPHDIMSFVWAGGAVTAERENAGGYGKNPNSIHADGAGELWLTSENAIYRLEVPPP
jgi:glucose/arabinose dehydrogenase